MIMENPYHRRKLKKMLARLKHLEAENISLKKDNSKLKRLLTLNNIEYKERKQ